MLQNKRK